MSDARRIALRGVIVFALGWPLIEGVNRAVSFPNGMWEWWIAPTLALEIAAACCSGAFLEKRREWVALLGATIATVICSTFFWLQASYACDVVHFGSVTRALVELREMLDWSRAQPLEFAIHSLRGGLGVAFVTWGRARWADRRGKTVALAITGAMIVTLGVHWLASAHGYYDPDEEMLRFDLGFDLVVVALAVLAPAWADALERRLAARADT